MSAQEENGKFSMHVAVGYKLTVENPHSVTSDKVHAKIMLIDVETCKEIMIDTSKGAGEEKYAVQSIEVWEK